MHTYYVFINLPNRHKHIDYKPKEKGGMMFKMKQMPFIFLSALGLLSSFLFLPARAEDTLLMPYDFEMEELVDIDATIEPEEYQESFFNEPTLITVYWGCDDSLMYVGLKAPSCAWLSIGFGSKNKEGANLLIATITEDSVEVENYLGTKEGYKIIKEDRIIDWDIDEEEDTVSFEFIYPLNFPAESGMVVTKLEHGKTYDFMLGMSKVVAPKGKQERRFAGTFMIEEKPAPQKAPVPEESLPAKKQEAKPPKK